MHDHVHAGIRRTNLIDVLRQEALMYGAVALPQNHFCLAQTLGSKTSL
jgi:hypothetical protein